MKIATKYNRVETQTFTLTMVDLKKAVTEYVKAHSGYGPWPLLPKREIDIELGESDDAAAILTCRFVYDEAPARSGKEG